MTIRFALPGDEPQLEKLVNDCGLHNPRIDYSIWTQPVIVAEEGDRILGFVQLQAGRPVSTVTFLCVHPSVEKQGIGRQLMDALDVFMRQESLPAYACFTDPHNVRIQRGCAERGMQRLMNMIQWMKVLS